MKLARAGCAVAMALIVALPLAGFGWMTWEASEASLPPLAKGMSTTDWVEGGKLFRQRMIAAYPVGSPDTRLAADLKAQGFTVHQRGDWRDAELRRFIRCGDKVWRVEWWAEAGRITELTTSYGPNCP